MLYSGANSLDQIIRFTKNADIYSFGILMAEIISRRPPYSENTVMSIPHIVQAVGHLREAIVNLEQMNNIRADDYSNTTKNFQKMQSKYEL